MLLGVSNPAGVGSSLQYIGDHAYGYSGEMSVNNGLHTALDFSTGNEYIKAKIYFYSLAISNDDFQYKIKLNGQEIVSVQQPQTYQSTSTGFVPMEVIITPNTHVQITLQNVTNTNAHTFTTVLVGEVYV